MSLPIPFPASAISLDYGATDDPYSAYSPHNGTDFSSASLGVVAGAVILASGDGVVHRSGWELGSQSPSIDRPNVNAGNSIDVDYPAQGVRVRYMHRPRGCPSPVAGDEVVLGGELGVIGETGYVTGAHLHMEAWDLATGRRVSPWLYFTRALTVAEALTDPAGDGATPFIPQPIHLEAPMSAPIAYVKGDKSAAVYAVYTDAGANNEAAKYQGGVYTARRHVLPGELRIVQQKGETVLTIPQAELDQLPKVYGSK